MTTNILSLPQFSSLAFTISNNAAWLDPIYFGAPGFPGPSTIQGCATIANTNIVTVPVLLDTSKISVGMQVSGTATSFPAAAYVGAVLSASTFSLVNAFGGELDATATNAEVTITFNPPPLDLTGIAFAANLRATPSGKQVFLVAQTGNGTIVNGGKLGTMSFNVSRTKMQSVPAGSYVTDLLAIDATTTINLVQQAPATVTVLAGITDINTLTGVTFAP